jgi:hypothetical protein
VLIRSNIPNEPQGRKVELGGLVYHFKPDAKGDNVCEVTEKAHVQRLVSIDDGEAYEIHDASLATTRPKVKAPKAAAAAGGDPLKGSSTVENVDGEQVPSDEEVVDDHTDPDEAKVPVPKKKAGAKKAAKKKG